MAKGFVGKLSKRPFVFIAGVLLGAVPCVAWYLASPKAHAPRPIAQPHEVRRDSVVKKDGVPEAVPAATNGIRIYFDGVHGARHLYNRDNRRFRTDYHTISGWYRLLQGLRTAGYSVEPEDYACFDAKSLEPYQVFMVGEETYHGRFMTDDERAALIEWVKKGGGLFITVEHTNAHYMGDVFNTIMKDLPIKARFDSICDRNTADPSSPDWVTFTEIVKHPVTEGVHDYSFDNGCSLDTQYGVLLSDPKTSWSDRYDVKNTPPVNNGNKKRDKGELKGPLAGVAAFEYGAGRVVVIADHNALTNTSLYQDDHHRLAMNAIRWLAHAEKRPELVDWQYPQGYDILIHTGAGSEFELHKKNPRGSYRTVYGFFGKEPQLRPWASKTLRAGDEAMLLGAPTAAYSEDELGKIDGALASGKPVIWLATVKSLGSEAAKQLEARFGFHVATAPNPEPSGPYEIHGPKELTHGIFRTFVSKEAPEIHVEGLTPMVQLSWGSQHIEDAQWDRPEVLIDLVSSKDVGPGKLYVVAPFDLFDDRGLNSLYAEGADVTRQQMAELMLTLVKNAMHDATVYAD